MQRKRLHNKSILILFFFPTPPAYLVYFLKLSKQCSETTNASQRKLCAIIKKSLRFGHIPCRGKDGHTGKEKKLPPNRYTYVHAQIHIYILNTHTHTDTYIQPYIHTNIHAYIHTYIHTYNHTYIHTYIHTHTHTRTHTHTHTHTLSLSLFLYIYHIHLLFHITCFSSLS